MGSLFSPSRFLSVLTLLLFWMDSHQPPSRTSLCRLTKCRSSRRIPCLSESKGKHKEESRRKLSSVCYPDVLTIRNHTALWYSTFIKIVRHAKQCFRVWCLCGWSSMSGSNWLHRKFASWWVLFSVNSCFVISSNDGRAVRLSPLREWYRYWLHHQKSRTF